jgi:dTDP-4-dehydrorhamnose reductase
MILLLGETSFIGKHIAKFLIKNKIAYLGSYYKKKKKNAIFFNLNNPNIINKYLKKNITHVILCSFVNSKPELIKNYLHRSKNLNLYKTIKLLKIFLKKRIVPVYISSDAVFNGKIGFYNENHKASPLTEYGKIKLAIEKFLIESGKNFLIVRIGRVFSINKNDSCFFRDIYFKLKNQNNIKMSNNHFFSPIYINDLCLFLYKLINNKKKGIFHLASVHSTSWFEIATLMMKKMLLTKSFYIKKKIIPVSIDEMYSEKRGNNLTLDNKKFNNLFFYKNKNITFYINLFFKNVPK